MYLSKFGLFTIYIAVFFLCSLKQTNSEVQYITRNSTDLCSVQPCLTLSQFAANSSRSLHSNMTLVFLPGTHYLNIKLEITNQNSFMMNSEYTTARIVCTDRSHNFYFRQLQYIHITDLEFVGCRGNRVENVNKFVVSITSFRGLGISEESSQQWWLIRNSALIHFQTRAQIVNSTFVSNKGGSVRANTRYHFQGFIPGSVPAFAPDSVGGAIFAAHCEIEIIQSVFESNGADFGGSIFAEYSTIGVRNGTVLMNNNATSYGGAICIYSSDMIIEESKLFGNTAGEYGGALCSYNSTTGITSTSFHSNKANQHGGVLYIDNSTAKIDDGIIFNNSAPIGAVIYAQVDSVLQYRNTLRVANNSAGRYAIIYVTDSTFRAHYSGYAILSNNLGSLLAFNSNITLMGYNVRFENNQPAQSTMPEFEEGGAVTLFQSNMFFDGYCYFQYNFANNGGAIRSIESKIVVNGRLSIEHNRASGNGGGVYFLNSEINYQRLSIFKLVNNTATYKGGGIHAVSSSVKAASDHIYLCSCVRDPRIRFYTGSKLYFIKNRAERGGGLSLEANAKLYILKYSHYPIYRRETNTSIFISNIAEYGGAVYVDDNSNSGTSCSSESNAECFFQVLALYDVNIVQTLYSNIFAGRTQSMHFSNNYAAISASTLYGGLLDRCAVSLFAEVRNKHPLDEPSQYDLENDGNGIMYFYDVSTPYNSQYYNVTDIKLRTNISISSNPVRVCICINNEPNCTHQTSTDIQKGRLFTVSLIAVDQIGQPVSATIQTSLQFSESGLAEGQLTNKIPAECTDLTFNIVSPHDQENVTLYASDGPCKDAQLSRTTVEIHFLPCTCLIGLHCQISELNETNCICECHNSIRQYVQQCDTHHGSFVKISQLRSWISYFNNSGVAGYLIYSNCPFDYCLSTSPPVDLNQPNGADAQCAFNRSSLLC